METEKIKTTILKIRDVHKRFGSREILKGISLNIEKGEIVSIMGPSGSGKSTLLYCMAGIISTDKGEVVFKQENIVNYTRDDLIKLRRTSFGFIFQFGELVPELPVRDNIALPLLLNGVRKNIAYQSADEWAEVVNIKDILHALPHTLSGGETQRVAIARAMAIDAEIIFADEPTGSLDSINSKKIMDLFIRLAREYHKTIIIVTHSKELADYADRHIILRDGVIESDTTIALP